MATRGVHARNKMLVLCSLLMEIAGFSAILQGRPTDGMLLVLFGMTFCVMIVFSGSCAPGQMEDTLPPDHDAVRTELLNHLFRSRNTQRKRRS